MYSCGRNCNLFQGQWHFTVFYQYLHHSSNSFHVVLPLRLPKVSVPQFHAWVKSSPCVCMWCDNYSYLSGAHHSKVILAFVASKFCHCNSLNVGSYLKAIQKPQLLCCAKARLLEDDSYRENVKLHGFQICFQDVAVVYKGLLGLSLYCLITPTLSLCTAVTIKDSCPSGH